MSAFSHSSDFVGAEDLIGVAGGPEEGELAQEALREDREQQRRAEDVEAARDPSEGPGSWQEAAQAPQDPPDEVEVIDGEVVSELTVVPWSYEALKLVDLGPKQLVSLLVDAREFEQRPLREFKRAVQDELLARMDAQTEWTIHLDDWDVAGDSPAKIDYDLADVRRVLKQLVDDGIVTQEQVDKAQAIKPKSGFEVSKRGIDKLLKLPGVKEPIEAIQRKPARYVKLTSKLRENAR